jgi:carbon storage regulator
MLILSRKQTESIHIRDDIVLTVLQIIGDRVRLGIDAPSCVSVHRAEVHEALLGLHPASLPLLPAPLNTVLPAQRLEMTELPAVPASGVKPWQKTCPNCKAVQHVRESSCGCGYVFAVRAGPCEGEPL